MLKTLLMTQKSYVMISYSMSNIAVLKEIGAQIRQMRLNQNISQEKLSEMSGLSRKAIGDIERNGKGTMMSIVQMLRALERMELLNLFSTEVLVSPLQVAKMYGKKRQKASRKS